MLVQCFLFLFESFCVKKVKRKGSVLALVSKHFLSPPEQAEYTLRIKRGFLLSSTTQKARSGTFSIRLPLDYIDCS